METFSPIKTEMVGKKQNGEERIEPVTWRDGTSGIFNQAWRRNFGIRLKRGVADH